MPLCRSVLVLSPIGSISLSYNAIKCNIIDKMLELFQTPLIRRKRRGVGHPAVQKLSSGPSTTDFRTARDLYLRYVLLRPCPRLASAIKWLHSREAGRKTSATHFRHPSGLAPLHETPPATARREPRPAPP